MASIKDILSTYRAEAGPGINQAAKSYGEGTLRANLAQEGAEAQQKALLDKQVAMTVQEQNILNEQRKQTGIQRDEQIKTIQKQGKEEKQRYQLNSEKILREVETQRNRLSQAETMDKFEVAASNIRLQDDKYRYEIADEGRRQRLNDATSFDYALKQAVFADEIEFLRDNIAFKKMLDLDDAKFQKELAAMDVNTAIDLAKMEIKGAQAVAQSSAIGSTVATAIDYGRSYANTPSKEPPPSTTSNSPTATWGKE